MVRWSDGGFLCFFWIVGGIPLQRWGKIQKKTGHQKFQKKNRQPAESHFVEQVATCSFFVAEIDSHQAGQACAFKKATNLLEIVSE